MAKNYPVRIIGNWAFSNLPNITDIVLPQSTSDIENYCVYNCPKLKTITCLSETPPSCYSTSFMGCEKMILYVKSKSAKEYYAAAEGWKWFKEIKVIGEPDDILVTNISLNATSATMSVGETKQLTATISPSNATNKSVTWSTSNSSVATVSSSGLVTAKNAGSATITCKTNDGSGKYATCDITVKNATNLVTNISLNATSATMSVGETKQLTATISPSNATNKSVTWSSSNSSVATVSSSGLVTAKSTGNTTITCKANDGSGKYATCDITVKNSTVNVTSITLSPSSASLTVGDTQQLTATISPSNATNKSVTWSSSNSSVATVSSSGLVTAKSAGSVTIKCKANDGSGKYATCSIKVDKVAGIEINETNFPDETFRKKLFSQDYGEDSVITENEISNITSIDVSYTPIPKMGVVIRLNGSISSLKGIEYFTALTSLNCRNNIITSIDLSKNTKLTELNCSQNRLSALDLSKNTALAHLSCGINQLTSLDVSNNTALTDLSCYHNNIKESAMDNLISSLPQNNSNKTYRFEVVNPNDANEGNVCTTTQVAAVKAKGWFPCYYNSNTGDLEEYEGSKGSSKGTEAEPFTPAEANEFGSSLAKNEQSDQDYYIRGMVSSIKEQFGTQYGNATFYISADGTEKDQFYIYRALYLDNTRYAGQDLNIRVGDDVVVCGKITNYLGTLPETVQNKAYVVSINGQTTGINDVFIDQQLDAPIYNLSGQRLSAPQKGINIIGGKKVVVK